MTDWASIKENVEARGVRKTDAVAKFEKIMHILMEDGKPYTVAQLRAWIDKGLNGDRKPEEPKVKVNWITVQYVLENKPGFKEVAKNTYRYEAKKQPAKK